MKNKKILTLTCEAPPKVGGVADLCGRLQFFFEASEIVNTTVDISMGFDSQLQFEPDLLVLHYVPQKLGPRGQHPELTRQLESLRGKWSCPWLLIVHEFQSKGLSWLKRQLLDVFLSRQLKKIGQLFDSVLAADLMLAETIQRKTSLTVQGVFPIGAPLPVAPTRMHRPTGTVGFYGALHPSRNPEIIVKAVSNLRQSGSNIKLVFVGRVRESWPEAFSKLELISNQKLKGAWEETGILSLKNLEETIDKIDVFVFPESAQLTERSTSLLSVLARKRPVIVVCEKIESSSLLNVVDWVEPHDLVEAIRNCLEDPQTSMAQQIYADEQLSRDSLHEQWFELIQRSLGTYP